MSTDAPEILSLEALRCRLRELVAQAPDGRDILHKPETRLVLRVADIAGYLGVEAARLYRFSRGELDRLSPDLQMKLSWFFRAWDRKLLVKVLEGTRLDKRGAGAAPGRGVLQYRAPAAAPAISLPEPRKQIRIEMTAQGPKLRL